MAEAIVALRNDPDLPAGLEFVAFASDWVRAGRFVRCFAVADGPQPHIASWMSDLENITSQVFGGTGVRVSIDGALRPWASVGTQSAEAQGAGASPGVQVWRTCAADCFLCDHF